MTHRAPGPSFPKIWLLPVLGLGTLAALSWTGYLSRSILLDFIAWWPVWLLLIVLAVVVRGRRAGRVRLSGIVPLLATLVLGLFVAAHFLSWPGMPSTDRILVGPPAEGVTTAAISARVDGELRVGAGAEHLYRVESLRLGGDVGVPDAEEQQAESAVVIELVGDANPGLYGFSGWDVMLSPLPGWSLTLAGELEADLTSLRVSGLQAEGSGDILLGSAPGPTSVSLSGMFTVEVAPGTPVRVVGQATVPADWETLSDGSRSPAQGDGWVLSVVAGSEVTLVYQLPASG
jgi:hypothetical protein